MELTTKKIMALAFAVAAVFAIGMGSFATQAHAEGETTNAADVAITKDFQMAPNLTCPVVTFDYTFTAKTVNGLAYDATHDGGAIPAVQIPYTAADAAVGTSVDRVKWKANLFANTTYSHAGEYVYLVQETEPGTPGAGLTYNVNNNSYSMHVYVANEGEGLKITGIGVFNATVADDGTVTEGAKVDATKPGTEHGTNGFIWTNKYDVPAKLTITKTVAGTYGDKTKQFSMDPITLTLPSTANQALTAAYKITRADNTTTTGTATFTAGAATITGIKLADGEKLEFIDTDNKGTLPIGTTYTIKESDGGTNGYENYTPSAKVVNEGVESTVTGTYTAGSPIVINADTTTNNNVVSEDGSSAAKVTNTYSDPTPTGILISNLPWVLLVVAAIGGLVLFVLGKRRRTVRISG